MDEQRTNRKIIPEGSHSLPIKIISRRHFLKETLMGTAGGLLLVGGFPGCKTASTNLNVFTETSDAPNQKSFPVPAIGYIARVSADESACASCGMCALVCAAVHGNTVGPSRARIRLDRDPFECEYISITCRQCDAPECYFACEVDGAFYIDENTGARVIDDEKCVGCGECVDACVFETSRIHLDDALGLAFKCDLCSGRPDGPACVAFCPEQALELVTGG